MPRTLVPLAAVLLAACLAPAADPPSVVVRVVTTDGKPAAGAKVWAYSYALLGEAEKEPTPLVADAAGQVTVARANGKSPQLVFARDSAGRVGSAGLGRASADGLKVVLADTTPRAGRITADGKPVAGAEVVPTSYTSEARGRRSADGPAYSIGLPEWDQARLATKTDADGRFTLPAVSGYSVGFRVKAAGFGEMRFAATGGVELDTKLVTPGSVALTAAGVDPAVLKGANWRLDADAEEPTTPGVRPLRFAIGEFDGTAASTVRALPPGRYTLEVYGGGRAPAVFVKGEPVEVISGKTAALTVTFGPAAKVTGKVIDKATGKGVAGANLVVNVHLGDDRARPTRQQFATTDADGSFVSHGPAGWYVVWMRDAPDGYAVPHVSDARQGLAGAAKVEVGKTHEFAAIALPRSVTFAGQIVLADGKPADGATVSTVGFYPLPSARETTDADGKFVIKNLPPDDAVAPRAKLGKAVNVPQTFELDKTDRPVSIEVSEANAAAFKGRVTDATGKPIAGAKVSLLHHVQGVGRNSHFGVRQVIEAATTDADGRYSFAGLWPRDGYSVQATATGYGEADGKQLTGTADEVQDFGTLKLARASLTVRGIVRDADGKPVAGAEVFHVDGPDRGATTSAPDGSFTLTGYGEGGGFAFARKAGYRLAAVPVTPGGTDPVTVTLAKSDAPPGPQPELSAAHKAALDRLTRHVLTRIWETRAEFGYGSNAIVQMARIDLDTAKRWRDEEKKRTGGKTDYTRFIDRAVRDKMLFDTAKQDIDEALAVLAGVGGEDGFAETLALGERLLAVDKAKAARVAEEAAVRARQRGFPSKLWSLADAGDLAVRAGNAAGGKKVLLEAAELAAKTDADGRDLSAYAVGMVAARLAPHDWPRAEALLNRIKDASEHNRWLSASAGRLAATDLAKAKELFDRFKPENSYYPSEARLRVAYRIAPTQPDEAVRVVESVSELAHRFKGYLGLASRFAAPDRGRTVKMIDAAFDMLERRPEEFRSWSNYGGRAAFGVLAAARAKEVGYPDVAALVARALAMRPTGPDAWSADDRENQLVNVAAALARVDPASARQVLAGVMPPEAFVERAVERRRDWLFALALADPERAVVLVDKLLERAKTQRDGRNALSGTGVVELGSILTATDPLHELTQYGSLFRELDYE